MSKPTYTVAEHTLTISGQYGVQIDLEGAAVTHEFTRLPEAEMKTDGAAIGTIQKGTFQLNGTKVYLNIMDTNASDYLLIRDGEGYGYYIVCETPEETEALYEEIMDQVG
ncbi:MAG TPA: hypothetical protein VN540_06225 [Clostridia bacterium]|nr:hypothetical protein [Clostridia bacterium]